jgi:alkylhydroperoxidase family enzyme
MRGPSPWSVGERELMAALVAKWNARAFCEGAHGAVAAKEMQRPSVDAALADFPAAPISDSLKATLAFLVIMTLRPTNLTPGDARAVLGAGVSAETLTDAIAVGAIFNIVTRYADALDFTLPTADEFQRAASMLLKRDASWRRDTVFPYQRQIDELSLLSTQSGTSGFS